MMFVGMLKQEKEGRREMRNLNESNLIKQKYLELFCSERKHGVAISCTTYVAM